ncbi:MAG: hypothetical protein SGJ10_00525 [Bacteroidota bacterium]|nr:hypothetical protein [Bacteroidota bacterium]
MYNRLFILFLLFIPNYTWGQTKLSLDNFSKDQKFDKSLVAAPVWRLKGSFINVDKEAVGEKPSTENVSIKLPDMKDCLDSGYTLLDFNGVVGSYNKSYVAVVMGNVYMRAPTKIWVDYNKNLDFTDDGSPVTIDQYFKYLELTFVNEKDTSGVLVYHLSRFDFSNNAKYRLLLREYYDHAFPERPLMWADIGFRLQIYKARTIDFKWEKDSFCIGLYDGNLNGIYNEPEEDMIVMGEYKSGYISTEDEAGAIEIGNGENSIIHSGIRYAISKIAASGTSMELTYNSTTGNENSLKTGQKLKKFKYKTVDQKTHHSKKLRWRKKSIVYFFNFENTAQFIADTTILAKLVREKHYKVVCLYYGKNPQRVKNFAFNTKGLFTVGYSKKEINHDIPIDRIPTVVELGRWLRVRDVSNDMLTMMVPRWVGKKKL